MTDPEDTVSIGRDELVEAEIDLDDALERPVPLETEPADATEQRIEVPDEGEDDYR